jgi:hypothetical protein
MFVIYDKDYKEILEELDKYCCFNGCLSKEYFYDEIIIPLRNSTKLVDWTYDSGATKLVLLFSGKNTVIKIPFNGSDDEYYCGGDLGVSCPRGLSLEKHTYCSDCSECGCDDCPRKGRYEYTTFSGAFADNGWDYCESEVEYYKRAEEIEIQGFFAKTWCIGSVNGHPIYAQVRAEMFEGSTSTREYPSLKAKVVEEYCDSHNIYCFNDWWLSDFVDFFGENALLKLDAFLEKYGIEDLHDGNLGYVEGVPVLVDYAGYNC